MKLQLKGKRFGRLTVLREEGRTKQKQVKWLCRCDCGKEKIIVGVALTGGLVVSCGCYRREASSKRLMGKQIGKKHGFSQDEEMAPTYNVWCDIKRRCYNKNNTHYKWYGERGITVCERWRKSFENFLADMKKRPEGLTLDRINNNGNYEPANCRWVTRREQSNNRRNTIFIETKEGKCALADVCRKLGAKYDHLYLLYKQGKVSQIVDML